MTRPTLQNLEAFAILARHVSSRKAADTLGVSRAVLSHPTRYHSVPKDMAAATRAASETPGERRVHSDTPLSANAHGKDKVT